jgi:general secretion pathway protein C
MALKRYFWVFTALATLAAAWLAAAGIGELLLGLAGSGLDMSNIPPRDLGADAAAAATSDDDRPIRLDDLLGGNLFALPPTNPDPEPDPDPLPPEPVRETSPPPSAEALIPPCPLALRVVALVSPPADRPEIGFATLDYDGRVDEYRVGQDIGGNRLIRIGWNRVYLALAGGQGDCFADIRYPELARAAPNPPPAVGPVDPKPPESGEPPPVEAQSREDRFRVAVEQSIETVSDSERNVQRSLINTILDNQDLAMRQARVMPHEQGGEVVGFKVYGIRRESLFGQLGIENGDLIQSINGIPMTGADKALQAYGRLRMADRIEVTVTRRGQQVNMVYNIR